MEIKLGKAHVFTVLVLISSILIAVGLGMKKPKARKARPKPTVPVVQTITLSPRTEKIRIEAYGNVIPSRKIDLMAEAEGRAIQVNPELVPGGILGKGELVVQVDPQDYDLMIKEREASVVEAEYNLELERARQNIAKKEWRFLENKNKNTGYNKSLALREPHMKNALAKLDAAESSLAAAELARSRTNVRSPFNTLVLEKFIDMGQVVSRQRSIATLVGIDYFWVQVLVPVRDLKWLRFPGDNNSGGSPASIIVGANAGNEIVRKGSLYKLLGDLDQKGRMARVLVRLKDPLGLDSGDQQDGHGSPDRKILLGSYVKVIINAGALRGVYAVPREAVHDGNRVWVLNRDNKLEIREVTVAWQRQEDLLITKGLRPGERLITSRIQSPLPGMLLKDESDASPKP